MNRENAKRNKYKKYKKKNKLTLPVLAYLKKS